MAPLGVLIICAALGVVLMPAPARTRAQALAGEEGLYLSQALPVLADAESNLDLLRYYLPLGSVKDVNDPTWTLAGQAAEALADDAALLQTFDPPASLGPANTRLSDALQRASDGASRAIDDLGAGNKDAGSRDLALLAAAGG